MIYQQELFEIRKVCFEFYTGCPEKKKLLCPVKHKLKGMDLNKLFWFVCFLPVGYRSFSQTKDSLENRMNMSGTVTVTNNGISIVPTFSLGKPAAIFMLSVKKSRFSFDPDVRFSLSGKPWSILFWGRYQLVNKEKFRISTGSHLGLNFRRSVLPVNGDSSELNIVRRYLAGELFPRVIITRNIAVGIYYLYSHGLDRGTIGNTHFITLNSNFTHIRLSGQLFLDVNPQFYYLNLDNEDGFFLTNTVTFRKKDFPVSFSSIVNKRFRSNITGSKEIVWNVSLNYSFNNKYVRL